MLGLVMATDLGELEVALNVEVETANEIASGRITVLSVRNPLAPRSRDA